jgi:hypothetical protein
MVESLWQGLLEQGFTTPVDAEMRNTGQVFLPQNPFVIDALCSPDGKFVLYNSTITIGDAEPVLRLSISTAPTIAGPCSTTAYNPYPQVQVLPQLTPPAGAIVQQSGGGGGGNSISAEAEIQSALSGSELAEHYMAQLEQTGWQRVDESATDLVAWSAWHFLDENANRWNAVFYVVPLWEDNGDQNGTWFATLRAEVQP